MSEFEVSARIINSNLNGIPHITLKKENSITPLVNAKELILPLPNPLFNHITLH